MAEPSPNGKQVSWFSVLLILIQDFNNPFMEIARQFPQCLKIEALGAISVVYEIARNTSPRVKLDEAIRAKQQRPWNTLHLIRASLF